MWQENKLFSVNLKGLDTQVGSKTWKECKIGFIRSEEIWSLQNNKSAATRPSFYILLKDVTDDNIGGSVVVITCSMTVNMVSTQLVILRILIWAENKFEGNEILPYSIPIF